MASLGKKRWNKNRAVLSYEGQRQGLLENSHWKPQQKIKPASCKSLEMVWGSSHTQRQFSNTWHSPELAVDICTPARSRQKATFLWLYLKMAFLTKKKKKTVSCGIFAKTHLHVGCLKTHLQCWSPDTSSLPVLNCWKIPVRKTLELRFFGRICDLLPPQVCCVHCVCLTFLWPALLGACDRAGLAETSGPGPADTKAVTSQLLCLPCCLYSHFCHHGLKSSPLTGNLCWVCMSSSSHLGEQDYVEMEAHVLKVH